MYNTTSNSFYSCLGEWWITWNVSFRWQLKTSSHWGIKITEAGIVEEWVKLNSEGPDWAWWSMELMILINHLSSFVSLSIYPSIHPSSSFISYTTEVSTVWLEMAKLTFSQLFLFVLVVPGMFNVWYHHLYYEKGKFCGSFYIYVSYKNIST